MVWQYDGVANVFFLILDAFSPHRLDPVLTPTLWKWAMAGGFGVGRAVMASCTYPNHATFVTGVGPEVHGITSNWLIGDGELHGSWETGPAVPTLFHQCRQEGISAEAVLGDHHLVGVMGARAADRHWPHDGRLTADLPLDGLGYPTDVAVLPRLMEALERRSRLTVGYFGSIDTTSHLFGPKSEEAGSAYRDLDRCLSSIDAALAWGETVVIVVSDHDQETALDLPGIDLRAHAQAVGVEVLVSDEGSGAVAKGPSDWRWLEDCPGVAGWAPTGGGQVVVWAVPGRFFGTSDSPYLRGIHGGINTRDQLALVSGGHPAVAALGSVVAPGPEAADWAPIIRSLLFL